MNRKVTDFYTPPSHKRTQENVTITVSREDLRRILDRYESLSSKLDTINMKLDNVVTRDDIQTINCELKALRDENEVLKNRVELLEGQVADLSGEVNDLRKKDEIKKLRLIDQEGRARRNNLIFRGIKYSGPQLLMIRITVLLMLGVRKRSYYKK